MPWWRRKKENKEPAVQPLAVNNAAKVVFRLTITGANMEEIEGNIRVIGEELRKVLVGNDGYVLSPYHISGGAYYFNIRSSEPLQIKVPYGWVGVTDDAIISYTPGSRSAYLADAYVTIIARDFQALRECTEKVIRTLANKSLSEFRLVSATIESASA
jgi:hypothetical protein